MNFYTATIHNSSKLEPQKYYAKWEKPDVTYYILYDSISIKCLEKANLQRQKPDQCLPRSELEGRLNPNEHKGTFGRW